MTDHDYTGCRDLLCQRCEGHSAGYRDGKSKALFEVSARTVDHPRGCGCEPCQAVAERHRRRGGAEARLLMDDDGPGRERRGDDGQPAGLETGLGILFGIELAEGDWG